MDIGTHCTVCGRLDFLPFDCRKCGKVLCGDHRLHDCIDADPVKQTVAKSSPKPAKASISGNIERRTPPKASKADPPKQSNAVNGQRLGKAPPASGRSDRAVAALDRLKQLMGGKSNSGSKSKWKPKPKEKTSISPEARRSATGNLQTPLSERVYFNIERAKHEYLDQLTQKTILRPTKTDCMFFEKEVTAGQILDRASKHLGLPNAYLQDSNHQPIDLGTPAVDLPEHLVLVPKR